MEISWVGVGVGGRRECLFPTSCVTSPSMRMFGKHLCVCPSRSHRSNVPRGSGNSRFSVGSCRMLSASSIVRNRVISRKITLGITSVP